MIPKSAILSIIFAVCSILGCSRETFVVSLLFAVPYLVVSFIPLKDEDTRFVLTAVFGFPLIVAAGNAVFSGILTTLLLVSLLAAGLSLTRKTVLCSVIVGVVAFLCAIQSSMMLSVVIAVIIALLELYILFIAEYRLRKQLKENPHETQ